MNDYWNNPPEYPEWPECCNQEMTVHENGDCSCDICDKVIFMEPDLQDPDFTIFEENAELILVNITTKS